MCGHSIDDLVELLYGLLQGSTLTQALAAQEVSLGLSAMRTLLTLGSSSKKHSSTSIATC